MAITRKISVQSKALVAPINYVYGETAISIVLTLTDFTIPTGATAAVYASVPGGSVYTQTATISGNDITISPVSGLFQPGKNAVQVEVSIGNKKLITFALTVNCENQLSETGSSSASSVRTSAQIDADVTRIKEDIGALDDLTTTDKSSLVSAINEVASSGGSGGGGTGGTTNYNALSNRPQINGVTLTGNKSSADLSLASASHTHTASDISGLPSATTVSQTLTTGVEIGSVNGTKLYAPSNSGEGGSVGSVNGKIGDVVLTASDVGAASTDDFSALSNGLSDMISITEITEYTTAKFNIGVGTITKLQQNIGSDQRCVSFPCTNGTTYTIHAPNATVLKTAESSDSEYAAYKTMNHGVEFTVGQDAVVTAQQDGYMLVNLRSSSSDASLDTIMETAKITYGTNNTPYVVQTVKELDDARILHGFVQGVPMDGTDTYKIDCTEGEWLVVKGGWGVQLFDSSGTMVKNIGYLYPNTNTDDPIRCDGTWAYARVYKNSGYAHYEPDFIPGKCNDGTLVIGDSYVHLNSTAMGEALISLFKTGSWRKGIAGYTSPYMVGMLLNIGNYGTAQYNESFINAWKNGWFNRAMIWAGANRVSSETLSSNAISDNVPTVTSGSLADLIDGTGTMTVNGNEVSTVADYHATFGMTTIGQLAFLIEYLQALQPLTPIYLMGYMPWRDGIATADSDFVIGVDEQLEDWYGVKFINSFRDIGLNKRNAYKYTLYSNGVYDCVHPSVEGSYLYWQKVLERNDII